MSVRTLEKFDYPAPRYTSYPTVPSWEEVDAGWYEEQLDQLAGISHTFSENSHTLQCEKYGPKGDSLSLYCHIPFCHKMCLYCGCSVLLNRRPEREALYVDYLLREAALVAARIGRRRVVQLHLGGGTPTKLSPDLLTTLLTTLSETFSFSGIEEIAIEIDPRTVEEDGGAKLRLLKELGVTRVSFGVQDTNPKVQEAVKRRQSLEVTKRTFFHARTLGFSGINIDLIYGLPYQTVTSFQKTVAEIVALRPDRISLFSYAQVPWIKKHQQAIRPETLPSREEKFQIYREARLQFVEAGYRALGMDHFALEGDELVEAFHQKRLGRNFQGYAKRLAETTIGLGITAIGDLQREAYVQNQKTLPAYYAEIDAGRLPAHRGKRLTPEDKIRREVIHTLLCYFVIDKRAFAAQYRVPFEEYFVGALPRLRELEAEGLLVNTPTHLSATPEGELLIRLLAMAFDSYPHGEGVHFSRSI